MQQYSVRPGWRFPFGTQFDPDGVNFSVFSRYASDAKLLLFERDDSYDWEDDAFINRPAEHAIIYELHVGGFTRHASSAVNQSGTFSGIIDKIPYLQELVITQVELMLVMAFDEQDVPPGVTALGLKNYWGYSTHSFFSPHPNYCVTPERGTHQQEFRNLVKALHRAGIGVILDVVFNHTMQRLEQEKQTTLQRRKLATFEKADLGFDTAANEKLHNQVAIQEELDELEAQLKALPAKTELLTDASLITCVVSAGKGDTVLKAARDLGVAGGVALQGRGTGIRERLGLLGIAVEVDKEIVMMMVADERRDILIESLFKAAELNAPAAGFIYAMPFDKAAIYVPETMIEQVSKSGSNS